MCSKENCDMSNVVKITIDKTTVNYKARVSPGRACREVYGVDSARKKSIKAGTAFAEVE